MAGKPGLTQQHNPLEYLTSRYWSPSALFVIDLVVVLTGLGFVSAAVNAIIRILFAMGRERVLPGSLSRLSRRHTPVVAIGCVTRPRVTTSHENPAGWNHEFRRF
jgi:amino acid transporter